MRSIDEPIPGDELLFRAVRLNQLNPDRSLREDCFGDLSQGSSVVRRKYWARPLIEILGAVPPGKDVVAQVLVRNLPQGVVVRDRPEEGADWHAELHFEVEMSKKQRAQLRADLASRFVVVAP